MIFYKDVTITPQFLPIVDVRIDYYDDLGNKIIVENVEGYSGKIITLPQVITSTDLHQYKYVDFDTGNTYNYQPENIELDNYNRGITLIDGRGNQISVNYHTVASATVHYVDQDGEALENSTSTNIESLRGETHEVDIPEFENYIFYEMVILKGEFVSKVEGVDKPTIKFDIGNDGEISLKYLPAFKLAIKYIDQDGNILKETEIKGLSNSKFDIPIENFDNCVFDEADIKNNSETPTSEINRIKDNISITLGSTNDVLVIKYNKESESTTTPSYPPYTPSTKPDRPSTKPSEPEYDENDTNKDGVVSCEELLGKGWIWDETSKSCILKGVDIVDTSTR